MKKIKIQCPAKINLTLKVKDKRPDGFHNIESIMQTISLYDYLTVALDKSDRFSIQLAGTSVDIPYNETNLVYRAAKLFFENIRGNYAINAFIEKNIPSAAGLAGGSSDAAGMLYGLNKLFDKPYNKKELHELCAKLGSDVSFCLEGGRQIASGRGEILTPIPFKEFLLSIIKPINLGISAKEAYAKFSKKLKIYGMNSSEYVNDLEWAVIDDYWELQQIKRLYPESIMSGSGSVYYVINDKFKPLDGYMIKNYLKSVPDGVQEV